MTRPVHVFQSWISCCKSQKIIVDNVRGKARAFYIDVFPMTGGGHNRHNRMQSNYTVDTVEYGFIMVYLEIGYPKIHRLRIII